MLLIAFRPMSESLLIILVTLFVWMVSAWVAGGIASDKERSGIGFGVVTFFFLGPLGPGFALLARHGAVEEAELLRAQDYLEAVE